jgi:hypothetical protein
MKKSTIYYPVNLYGLMRLALVDDESIQKIMDLNEKLHNPSLNVNNLVNELGSLNKNAAEKALVFKSFTRNKRKHKRIKPKKAMDVI